MDAYAVPYSATDIAAAHSTATNAATAYRTATAAGDCYASTLVWLAELGKLN